MTVGGTVIGEPTAEGFVIATVLATGIGPLIEVFFQWRKITKIVVHAGYLKEIETLEDKPTIR